MVVLYGMWLERYMIIVSSPASGFFAVRLVQFRRYRRGTTLSLFGSIGLFLTLFALFVRFLPMISMYEVKELLPFSEPGGGSEK